MCFPHRWEYIGYVKAHTWLAGVSGGVPIETEVEAKQCKKCGKLEEI